MRLLFLSSLAIITIIFNSSCIKLGPELSPYPRPDVEGFVVTLHKAGLEEYQIAVWHPQGHFYAFSDSQLPFQAKLIGDPQTPRTSSSEKLDYTYHSIGAGVGVKLGPLQASTETATGSQQTTVTRTVRTAWNFDKARWEEKRPFRLVLIRGYSPVIPEKRMELEIVLGPVVGSAEGLVVRQVSKDPSH